MSNLTMPRINVIFTNAAKNFVPRGERGVVCLLLRDDTAALLGQSYELLSAADAPAGLAASNRAAIAQTFLGGLNPPRKALLYIFGGTGEGAVTLEDALGWAATQQFDWLAGPLDISAAEAEAVAAWIEEQRSDCLQIYKAVLPNYAADSEAVVNFVGAGIKLDAETVLDAEDYCPRVAGLLAGTPLRISATYAELPEVADCTRLTPTELDAAVGAGKLVLWYDGAAVRLGRAVNSLTTTSADKDDGWKKIKLVGVIDQMFYELRMLIITNYIGKFPNSYDNKLLLVTAIRDYFQALVTEGVLQPGFSVDIDEDAQRDWLVNHGYDVGSMSDREIREANTGSEVFLAAAVRPLDAIEDVTLNITI